MNFLAHLYLSPPIPEGWLGSLLGDFVKGPLERAGYPAAVTEAIRVHRAVDSFTDTHPAVREAKARFSPATRRYAGVVLDLAFDHFLARDWDSLHAEPLDRFARRVYGALEATDQPLPERFARMLPWMVSQDWLVSYRSPAGTREALERMSRRLADGSGLRLAALEMERRYPDLERDFERFFPALVAAFAPPPAGGGAAPIA